MAIDPPATHTIYVVTRAGIGGDSTIDVVDPARGGVSATIPGVEDATAVTIAPDHHELYVANYALKTVSVVDTRTRAVTATIPVEKEPWAVRADPSANELYVMTGDEFTVIDTVRRVVTSRFRIENEYPEVSRGFAVIAGRLYVPIPIGGELDWAGGKVAVIDIATGGVITDITVGRSPPISSSTPAGPTIYVVNRYDETISVIDPVTDTVTGPHPVEFEAAVTRRSIRPGRRCTSRTSAPAPCPKSTWNQWNWCAPIGSVMLRAAPSSTRKRTSSTRPTVRPAASR